MLMEIFVLPSSGRFISKAGLHRLVNSVPRNLCSEYTRVVDFTDINNQKNMIPWFAVFFDNEYIDLKLARSIQRFLLFSRGIDMFSLFLYTQGSSSVLFQPRIFKSEILLDPRIDSQPLPHGVEQYKHEKILDGWVYRD